MVRLRLPCAFASTVSVPCFNPTMVRLRPLCVNTYIARRKVSIPLWCDCDNLSRTWSYRESKVSIPLWCDCDNEAIAYLLDYLSSFNPTMVRLRPPRPQSSSRAVPCFNPTMVRLRLRAWPTRSFVSSVSIPLWCDCDAPTTAPPKSNAVVSIPLWCDCDLPYLSGLCCSYNRFNPTMVRLRPAWSSKS